jgi:hypothetical protein
MSPDLPLLACTVCFGAADGPMLDAARLGVLVMAGFTAAMLMAFASFFIRIARRTPLPELDAAPRLEQPLESDLCGDGSVFPCRRRRRRRRSTASP